MNEVSLQDARKHLGELVDAARLRGETTVITRNGKPAAAIAPLPLLQHLAREHPGIGQATGPAGMWPEGRPAGHLAAAHDLEHAMSPGSQDHAHWTMEPHARFAVDLLDPAARAGLMAALDAARGAGGPVWVTDGGEVVAEIRLIAVDP